MASYMDIWECYLTINNIENILSSKLGHKNLAYFKEDGVFDLRKIFDLRKFFAVPKNFLKSKIHCNIPSNKNSETEILTQYSVQIWSLYLGRDHVSYIDQDH